MAGLFVVMKCWGWWDSLSWSLLQMQLPQNVWMWLCWAKQPRWLLLKSWLFCRFCFLDLPKLANDCPIQHLHRTSEVTMAGNGMDVPSVGFVMLTVMLADFVSKFACTSFLKYARHWFAWRKNIQMRQGWTLFHKLCSLLSFLFNSWPLSGIPSTTKRQETKNTVGP